MKEYNSQKDNNKILERNINSVNTKALLIEDGRGKAHLALSASERENIKLKRKAKQLKNLFEEIIAKVYKSLQTINKNEVYKCACELYKLFCYCFLLLFFFFFSKISFNSIFFFFNFNIS